MILDLDDSCHSFSDLSGVGIASPDRRSPLGRSSFCKRRWANSAAPKPPTNWTRSSGGTFTFSLRCSPTTLAIVSNLRMPPIEAIALEGYRDQTLTLYQVSEMLGFSRVETEDFLGQHHVPLAVINEADLDREAALFEAASRRNPR